MNRKIDENDENATGKGGRHYFLRSRPPLADLGVNEKEKNTAVAVTTKKETKRERSVSASFLKPKRAHDEAAIVEGTVLSIFDKRPVSPIKEKIPVRSKNIKKPSRHHLEDDYASFSFFDPNSDDYYEDIIKHAFSMENKFVIKTNDVLPQYEKQWKRRNYALSWAYCFQNSLCVTNETFMKSVYLFDNILRSFYVPEEMTQLLILTVIWIEQKDTGGRFFGAKTLLSLKRSFTQQTLLYLEKKVLQILDFNTMVEEPIEFVRYYLKKLNLCGKMLQNSMYTVSYLIELYMFNENFSKITPSKLAAAAVLYDLRMKAPFADWDILMKNNIVYYSTVQLEPVLKELLKNAEKANERGGCFKEAFDRYNTEEKFRVSVKVNSQLF